jgi:hypothetical protein
LRRVAMPWCLIRREGTFEADNPNSCGSPRLNSVCLSRSRVCSQPSRRTTGAVFLEEIRNLTVGESSEAEVQNLVDKNGGEAGTRISGVCELDAKSHSIMVSSRE